jgi:hypothetical protein
MKEKEKIRHIKVTNKNRSETLEGFIFPMVTMIFLGFIVWIMIEAFHVSHDFVLITFAIMIYVKLMSLEAKLGRLHARTQFWDKMS